MLRDLGDKDFGDSGSGQSGFGQSGLGQWASSHRVLGRSALAQRIAINLTMPLGPLTSPPNIFIDPPAILPNPLRRTIGFPATNCDRSLRYLDIAVAIAVLVLVLPVLVLIAVAIKCTSPGPVIFAHYRIGRGGRMFACLKFRSMALNGDDRIAHLLATDPASRAEWNQTHKLRNDPRITRLGSFLRKTSLDELPQMINVLRGEMSLVGPRPIVPAESYRYGRYIRHYCSTRPGITGMWQINGRNAVSYRRRVALDILYIRSRSMRLNLYILSRTLPCIFFGNGH